MYIYHIVGKLAKYLLRGKIHKKNICLNSGGGNSESDCCALLLTLLSYLLILVTLPVSLCMCIKVTSLPCHHNASRTLFFALKSLHKLIWHLSYC